MKAVEKSAGSEIVNLLGSRIDQGRVELIPFAQLSCKADRASQPARPRLTWNHFKVNRLFVAAQVKVNVFPLARTAVRVILGLNLERVQAAESKVKPLMHSTLFSKANFGGGQKKKPPPSIQILDCSPFKKFPRPF